MISSPQPILPVCPGRDALVAFALGRLSEADIASLAEHLDTCPGCASLLDALHASPGTDSVQERVRRCLLSPPPREIEAWDAIEAQLTLPDRPGVASPADFTVDPAVGTTLAGYQLLERLGKGGMGVVYRAVQLALGRPVALKTLHHQALDAPALCARLRTEGAALARLDHPGIVRVLDLAEHRGVPFLVMELVEGQTLGRRLRGGVLAPRAAAGLVRDLAVAVAYAHSRGVLHRDLKPSNVLLDAAGAPRVADFGLAKLLDRDDGLTASDMVLGTPAYMAPEQAGGLTSRVGPAADVWALGVILYECLTGRPPFKGESKLATLGLVRSARLVPPSGLRPGLPPGLEAICLKCLEKDPARRYPGAAALADDLNRWLAGQRPEAIPGWARRIARKFEQRSFLRLLIGGIGALLLCGVWWFPGNSGSPRAEEESLQEITRTLREGQPRELVGSTGKPGWMRQLTGQPLAKDPSLAEDGSFTVVTWSHTLIELLEDPQHDCYRLTAQVRHQKSDQTGEAGLYVGRVRQPWEKGDMHFFLQLSYNDVRRYGANAGLTMLQAGAPGPAIQNDVRLFARLHSDDRRQGSLDHQAGGTAGPRFQPAGERQAVWRDLELTVTPEKITARWDGQAFEARPGNLIANMKQHVSLLLDKRPDAPALKGFQPVFHSRGGLGLILGRGQASFRNVRIVPLIEVKP